MIPDSWHAGGRLGPLTRGGSTLNASLLTVLAMLLGTQNAFWASPGWVPVLLIWAGSVVICIRAWVRPAIGQGLGLQVGVARSGPYRGRDVVATHDGTTWVLDVAADPANPNDPASSTHTFDNDEFTSIEKLWSIRWDAQ